MQVCKEYGVTFIDHPTLSGALRNVFAYYHDLSINDEDSQQPAASKIAPGPRKGLAYLSSPYAS